MKKSIQSNLFLLIWMSLLCFSCKKMIEVEPPKNQVVTQQVFSDSVNANAAVTGLYVRMMGTAFMFGFANGGITAYTGLYADELYSTKNNPVENEFYSNSLSDVNSNLAEFWKNAYSIIYQANAVIEGLSESNTLSLHVKQRYLGEAKLVRALIYFNLVNLFGDVPYVATTDYSVTALLPRTSVEQVYAAVIRDLQEAKDLLPASYPSNTKIRPVKFAALALLSRVQLYQKKWQEAEVTASLIIDGGVYQLQSDLTKTFAINSSEAIWQLPPVQPGGFETTEGMMFVPFGTTVLPGYPLSNQLLNAFELNDNRRTKWIAANIVNGQSYYYPNKYQLNYSGASSPQEYYMLFRLSEQYLIRAEAKAQQNKIADALSDLNIVRKRAGLNDTTAQSKNELLGIILDERQVELFCEWGHRWFDLKRFNEADNILSVIKAPDWVPTDKLFPIPFKEIQLNPSLEQNPGY